MLETDESYAAETFCGSDFFLFGDVACFLDTLLSTGVHLAMSSALLRATSVATQLRGEVSGPQALSFIEKSYRQAYLRFLVFVSASCDKGRGKEWYFSEAERLSHYKVKGQRLRQVYVTVQPRLGLSHIQAGSARRRPRRSVSLR